MHNLINAYPLYNFLKYCNASSLDKVVLDCGAGGSNPPLSLFKEFGYETHGVERCKEQLNKAITFCESNNIDLSIIEGNMLKLPFKDQFFSFLYSFNTSVHMKKIEFSKALFEFNRVLKNGGLCYANFLSEECETFGQGILVGDGEYIHTDDEEEVLYCHYRDDEIDSSLEGFDIIYKEKRIIKRKIDDKYYESVFLDYILKKKEK